MKKSKLGAMQLGQEIPKKEFMKWIQALRSGDYSQTRGSLYDPAHNGGHCCLGVLCKEAKGLSDDNLVDVGLPEQLRLSNYNLKDWSRYINDDFGKKVNKAVPKNYAHYGDHDDDTYESGYMGLSELNDDLKMTFDEIADALELVYVHKALE